MRTLCIACHAEVTAAQCAERRSERAKAKRQLKCMLANLKTVQDKQKVLKMTHITYIHLHIRIRIRIHDMHMYVCVYVIYD